MTRTFCSPAATLTRVEFFAPWSDGIAALMTLVPNGPPSLIGCNKLTVEGKVAFAAGVVFKGDVKVVNKGDEIKTVAAGTYEDKTVEL